MKIGIYSGCFDPITFGHLWVVDEGIKLFDKLYVMIGKNTAKQPMFTEEDRLTMLRECIKDDKVVVGMLPENVVVQARKIEDTYKDYDVDVYIIRGIRDPHDFKYEETICQTIRRVDDKLRHVFVIPPEGHIGVSSTAVKEQWSRYGWDMTSHLVPDPVLKMMKVYQAKQTQSRLINTTSLSSHQIDLVDTNPPSIYGGVSPYNHNLKYLEAEDLYDTMVLTSSKIRNFHKKIVKNGFVSYARTVTATQVQAMLDFCDVEMIASEKFHLRKIQIDSVTPTGTRYLPCSRSLGPIIVDLKTAELAALDTRKILGDVVILDGKHRWLDAKELGRTTIQAWVGEKAFEKLGLE
jgi:pantetheine-phosphate adenylyltransferase